MHFDGISVRTVSEELVSDIPGLTKRCLQIQMDKMAKQHKVTQYHYTSWPDFGVPDTPRTLVDLVNIMREEHSKNEICLVHCSAGVGRTGTMIALNKIMEEIDNGAEEVDVFETVLQLRSERVQMVQKQTQYVFLYGCIEYYLSTKEKRGDDQNIDSYYVYNLDEDHEADSD